MRHGEAYGYFQFVPALSPGKLTCMGSISGFLGPMVSGWAWSKEGIDRKSEGGRTGKWRYPFSPVPLRRVTIGWLHSLIKATTPVGWFFPHSTLSGFPPSPFPAGPRTVTASCCYQPLGCHTFLLASLYPVSIFVNSAYIKLP